MRNLKAIVVGAGMGGLTTAVALRQAGFEVEVYDRVRELRPAGAAISLWSNGIKVLNRLGLGDQMAAIGGCMERMAYFSHTGELLTDFSLTPLVTAVGQCPHPVSRTELQAMLLQAIGAETVRLGAKCVGVKQDADSATAWFDDGSSATGDLVIGADGTRSIVRDYVLGYKLERRYVGYVNWNGIVPATADLAPKTSWALYVGDHKRASLMPISGDRFYFFLDVPMPYEATSALGDIREDLTRFFTGWAAPVQTLIQRLDPETTNRVLIHDTEPLPQFVRGRVALVGDAAHTTAPDLGQGGCQALEDAFVLTNYLHSTNLSVADALQRYETARKDRVADVIQRARQRSDITHGKDPAQTQAWYAELRQEDGNRIIQAIARTILAGPLN
jgi:FAD-dependent urate hydroxylase